eukprot:TRINITY_DN74161_c0_g1_i1.p1 TRINITY_DN74161_c0_g1~~TRINITY_DN74161_c0_g1_i1.p1  ORF type:complete len:489 (-),score=53.50 TRINITY_DN74161_c0_g1_i1:406-1806(-)
MAWRMSKLDADVETKYGDDVNPAGPVGTGGRRWAPSTTVLASEDLVRGAEVEAKYGDDFYPARIVGISQGKRWARSVKVHYIGYEESDDAWLSLSCVRQPAASSAKHQREKVAPTVEAAESLPPKRDWLAQRAWRASSSQTAKALSNADDKRTEFISSGPVDVRITQDLSPPALAAVLEQLRACIAQRLVISSDANVCLHVFGSALNGFGNPTSDIDVVMEVSIGGVVGSSKNSVTKILKAAKPCFVGASSKFRIVQLIMGAKIPIIKLEHKKSGRALDLSANNLTPLANTYLLRAYASLDSRVAEFGKKVKQWAKDSGVCDASCGWLAAYDLVLMSLYFLQATKGLPSLQLACPDHDWSQGEVSPATLNRLQQDWKASGSESSWFSEFFSFYSREFKWGSEVVSIRVGKRGSRSDPSFGKLKRSKVTLDIEDPFLLDRNLANHLQSTKRFDDFLWTLQSMDEDRA